MNNWLAIIIAAVIVAVAIVWSVGREHRVVVETIPFGCERGESPFSCSIRQANDASNGR